MGMDDVDVLFVEDVGDHPMIAPGKRDRPPPPGPRPRHHQIQVGIIMDRGDHADVVPVILLALRERLDLILDPTDVGSEGVSDMNDPHGAARFSRTGRECTP